MNRLHLILTYITAAWSLPFKIQNIHHDAGLNIIQLATKYGYPIESHHVLTDDGYILTLHRIPHGLNGTTSEPRHPILLMHGLLSSSVDWINLGPGTALGLLLADNGYDVWLGNRRGNTWSRGHLRYDPNLDSEKFFDFSFHEVGVYDLPAKIDYILSYTKQEKIFYVGHSEGTTDFFVMASEKPEYNEKIKLMTALSPVAYVGKIPNPLLAPVVENIDLIYTLVEVVKIHEVLPHYDYFTDLGFALCSDGSPYQKTCSYFLNMLAGFDWQIDPNFISVIATNAPAGCSMKQILHYLQEIQSGSFVQYDYGAEDNKIKYGQVAPPSYDILKITAPISLYYGNNDWLNAVEDVLQLADELPNVVNLKKVPMNQFNHLDFLWASNVVKLVYKDVITEIKNAS